VSAQNFKYARCFIFLSRQFFRTKIFEVGENVRLEKKNRIKVNTEKLMACLDCEFI